MVIYFYAGTVTLNGQQIGQFNGTVESMEIKNPAQASALMAHICQGIEDDTKQKGDWRTGMSINIASLNRL